MVGLVAVRGAALHQARGVRGDERCRRLRMRGPAGVHRCACGHVWHAIQLSYIGHWCPCVLLTLISPDHLVLLCVCGKSAAVVHHLIRITYSAISPNVSARFPPNDEHRFWQLSRGECCAAFRCWRPRAQLLCPPRTSCSPLTQRMPPPALTTRSSLTRWAWAARTLVSAACDDPSHSPSLLLSSPFRPPSLRRIQLHAGGYARRLQRRHS